MSLNASFSAPKANLTAILVSLPASGPGTILTRGWIDPENRSSDWTTEPVTPGTFYRLGFDLQPKDVVVPAGRRLGLMVLSSDREHTVRPAPGTLVTLDVAGSGLSLPVVGGAKALATATGGDLEEGTVTGTVPATLSLTVGGPASFGAFTPGVTRDYLAVDGGQRGQHGRRGGPERRRSERHRAAGERRVRAGAAAPGRARNAANTSTAYNNVGSRRSR